MKHAIILENVNKSFMDKQSALPRWLSKEKPKKFTVVNNVSLKVQEGEIFGILGPNGCGKSTIVRMMATLLVPDSGNIKVKGIDVIKNPEKVKKIVNRVSVEASFFKSLSPKENLLYAARLYGIPDKEAKKRFTHILEELNFPKALVDQPIRKCSRGQQQKIAIARSFLSKPEVLLMDEPTTGLDPKSKQDVHEFLKAYMQKHKIAILLCSHDMDEVDRLCKNIAIMDSGKILDQGTSKELKSKLKRRLYELESKDKAALKKIKFVKNVTEEDGNLRFELEKDFSTKEIIKMLDKAKVEFHSFHKVPTTLEDVFIELTGKTLEEE